MSDLEDELYQQIEDAGLPLPEREVRFAKPRRFRFDFCWPDRLLAAEVDGATWSGGRHARGSGIETDSEKYSIAATMGFRVLRFTRRMIKEGVALEFVRVALESLDPIAKAAGE